jgi:hypothetical protein
VLAIVIAIAAAHNAGAIVPYIGTQNLPNPSHILLLLLLLLLMVVTILALLPLVGVRNVCPPSIACIPRHY